MDADLNTEIEAPRTEFRIPSENLPGLKAKIARLAKRAAKLGAEAPTLTVHPVEEIRQGNGTVKFVYPVTVTGPAPRFAGWALTAVIELDHAEPDAPNVVHALNDEADPAWRTLAERCDHCNVNNRRRNKLVVVTHGNGDRKVIGTTCLRDFLGHQAPATVAGWAEYVEDLDVAEFENEGFGGAHVEERYDAAEYLGWVARSCVESGWIPKSAVPFGGTSTSDDALAQLQLANGLRRPLKGEERPEALTEAELARGAAAAAWAASVEPTNDYLANLNAVALKTSLRTKDLGLAASAISGYAKAQEREIERAAAKEATSTSLHVGSLKERIEFTGTVSGVRFIEGNYGTRAMVKILSEGNLLVWWCSNAANAPAQGDEVTGKATIKAHETYQGEVQTVITRAKLEVTAGPSFVPCGSSDHYLGRCACEVAA